MYYVNSVEKLGIPFKVHLIYQLILIDNSPIICMDAFQMVKYELMQMHIIINTMQLNTNWILNITNFHHY